jgi:CRISPR system Cascade subunit CasD
MKEYLIFCLYGMMASWGDIAVGEYRPTYDRPSKSAVLGMIAAALGIRRDEEAQLRELAVQYRMALRVDTPGTLLRDYHTAQVPSSGKGRNKVTYTTRKSELSGSKNDLKTILSSRDYRCDAHYTVCLWNNSASPPYPLSTIRDHLEKPVFNLCLGRKSCPPALPLHPQIIQADTISDAFSSVPFEGNPFTTLLESNKGVQVFWEGEESSGFVSIHVVQRRDDPLSKRRWQFGNRTEYYTMINKPAEVR